MKGLKIEPVRKKDREAAAAFMAELWRGRPGAPQGRKAALARLMLLEGADYDAFLFEREKRPVGYALARDNGDHVVIRQFVIAPEERRRGLGRACFALLEEQYDHPEFRAHVLDDDPDSAAFWPRLGFARAAVVVSRPAPGPST